MSYDTKLNHSEKYLLASNNYTKKYLLLKTQNGGAVFKDSDKNYSGSGILLVDLYNNKPCLILFSSKRKGNILYGDLGGHIDKEDMHSIEPLLTCATREAFEESMGLFNFTKCSHMTQNKNRIIDIKNKKNQHYRCFIVPLDTGMFGEIENQNYTKNKTILNARNVPNVFKETHDVRRFYISDMIDNGIKHTHDNFETKDIFGDKHMIYSRTVNVIKKALDKEIFNSELKNPIKMIKINSIISV